MILLDDVGFGHPGTFGGPIPTPNLDKLAGEGLRYNQLPYDRQFARPTRAAVLTGLQPSSGRLRHDRRTVAPAIPGYDSVWPLEAATVAEVLKQNGYSTAAWGKWHNTPDWETTPIGPFNRWPTGEGFEYWYGFHGGETSQWEPQLFRNETPVEPPQAAGTGLSPRPKTSPTTRSPGSTAQKSIAPDKPFFIYFAPGAAHAPLHVPKEWIDKFKGQFDQGWDKVREETIARQKKLGVVPADTMLTPRPKEIEAWDSLSPDAEDGFMRGIWRSTPAFWRIPTIRSAGCSTPSPRSPTATTR